MHYPLHGGMEIVHKCLIKSSTATLSLSNIGFANSMSSLIYSHGKKINNRRHCLRAVECFSCSGRFFKYPNCRSDLNAQNIVVVTPITEKYIFPCPLVEGLFEDTNSWSWHINI